MLVQARSQLMKCTDQRNAKRLTENRCAYDTKRRDRDGSSIAPGGLEALVYTHRLTTRTNERDKSYTQHRTDCDHHGKKRRGIL